MQKEIMAEGVVFGYYLTIVRVKLSNEIAVDDW